MMHVRVVWNIDLFEFERETWRYEYNAIHLQYRDIQYDAMHLAITRIALSRICYLGRKMLNLN